MFEKSIEIELDEKNIAKTPTTVFFNV